MSTLQQSARPVVDLVIVIDSSESMEDEALGLSDGAEKAIETSVRSCPSDLRVEWFGLEGVWENTRFGQTLRAYLTEVCNVSPSALRERDKVRRGAAREDGARAMEDVAKHFDWRPDAKRAMLWLGDESLEGGGGRVKSYDIAAANRAIAAAQSAATAVHTYLGTSESQHLDELSAEYARVAHETGGQAYTAAQPLEGFVDLLERIICATRNQTVVAKFLTPDAAQNADASKLRPFELLALAGRPGRDGRANGTGSVARFKAPHGVAIDSEGVLYVADRKDHVIRRVTSNGKVTTLAGLAGRTGHVNGKGNKARFIQPFDLTVGKDGALYVTEYGNHVIRRVTPDGDVTTFAGTAGKKGHVNGHAAEETLFHRPAGIVADVEGTLYITEYDNHTIRRITLDGEVTTLAGLAGKRGHIDGDASKAKFNRPFGIELHARALYVADSANHVIRIVTMSGKVSTLTGVVKEPGKADGKGTTASFNIPAGIALGPDDALYVADSANQALRRVTPDGQVSTVPAVAGSLDDEDDGALTFGEPTGLAISNTGMAYIADCDQHAILAVLLTDVEQKTPAPASAVPAPESGESPSESVVPATEMPLPPAEPTGIIAGDGEARPAQSAEPSPQGPAVPPLGISLQGYIVMQPNETVERPVAEARPPTELPASPTEAEVSLPDDSASKPPDTVEAPSPEPLHDPPPAPARPAMSLQGNIVMGPPGQQVTAPRPLGEIDQQIQHLWQQYVEMSTYGGSSETISHVFYLGSTAAEAQTVEFKDIAELEALHQSTQQVLIEVQTELEQAQSAVSGESFAVSAQSQAAIGVVEDGQSALRIWLSAFEAMLTQRDERLTASQAALAQALAAIGRAQTAAKLFAAERDALWKWVMHLKATLVERQQAHATMKVTVAQEQAARETMQTELSTLQKKVTELQVTLAQREIGSDLVKQERDRVQSELAGWRTRYDQTQKQLSQVGLQLGQIKQQVQIGVADLGGTQSWWRERETQLQAKIVEGATALAKERQERQRLQVELERWQRIHTETQQQLSALRLELQRVTTTQVHERASLTREMRILWNTLMQRISELNRVADEGEEVRTARSRWETRFGEALADVETQLAQLERNPAVETLSTYSTTSTTATETSSAHASTSETINVSEVALEEEKETTHST